MQADPQHDRTFSLLYPPEAFSRLDEGDDRAFYEKDRFVSHLDVTALATVERLIASLVGEPGQAVLDLMASWDSHLPPTFAAREVVGLGLNHRELEANQALTRVVVHDVNADPRLPFEDGSFDVVLNTVSVDYLIRPLEVFAEVGRVLRPGGLFLVIFSNRLFREKAVRIWRESSEEERVMVVEDYFAAADTFEPPEVFVSKGRPRPTTDRYAHLGLPSDPIYAVYAERSGGERAGQREVSIAAQLSPPLDLEELRRREARLAESLECPHCRQRLTKWRVPEGPFIEWDAEFLFICFNDRCPYLERGWEVMASQGLVGFSYRLMYNPISGGIGPVPVQTLTALREGIALEIGSEPSLDAHQSTSTRAALDEGTAA